VDFFPLLWVLLFLAADFPMAFDAVLFADGIGSCALRKCMFKTSATIAARDWMLRST